ncbi:MAG TPA: hypothetical protein VFJ16_03365 [Longimicrobium sp.]|nr:hypothetical protein [Longimicrobium sp.]
MIRTRREWAAFRAFARQAALPEPAADFGREVVLAAAMGFRPSTGYEIAIGPVMARGDTVAATVASTSPGAGLEGDLVLTPLQVVRMPRSAGPVVWIERGLRR